MTRVVVVWCSPIANLLTRVSGLLLGQSQHMAPPQPPPPPAKPWLDPECRTIDDKFWASPGDLGLKVHTASPTHPSSRSSENYWEEHTLKHHHRRQHC